MRIGILTLPFNANYGGILQAYALQTVLKRMGYEVWHIQRRFRYELSPWVVPLCYGKRILKNMLGIPTPIFYERKKNRERSLSLKYTDVFIKEHIRVKQYEEYDRIEKQDFEVIIVGSDQIWRPEYFIGGTYKDIFLGWASKSDIKRISYAASFGEDDIDWSEKQIDECKLLLQKFDAVSVRERSGIDICKKYFAIDAVNCLDPTLLLSTDDYTALFKKANAPQSEGNLHYYFLDETPEKMKLLEDIAKGKGLKPFRVNSRVENHDVPIEERIQPPVEKWLRAFYDSDFVVTDSYHACIFSILFKKQFIAVGNVVRGLERFNSLLGLFGLENRLVLDISLYKDVGNIDYSRVTTLLNEKKQESLLFLKKSLSN